MKGGSVYIVTNKPNGTLYLGVTNDLGRRIFEHRSLQTRGFTQRYRLTQLVWYEHYADIRDAIQRERTMKHWSRAWKVRLILDLNPNWTDLYEELAQCLPTSCPGLSRASTPTRRSFDANAATAWMAWTSPTMTQTRRGRHSVEPGSIERRNRPTR